MLSRENLYTLFWLKKQENCNLSVLPEDIDYHIATLKGSPNSDIAKLLHHIAYGCSQDLIEINRMLNDNPRLVLDASDVITRSGLLVEHTTPLECALGSGSPEVTEIIHNAFERITDDSGKLNEDAIRVRTSQYNRYRPHIENLLNEEHRKPYDFTWLMEALKKSSPEERSAALKNTLTEGTLYDALEKFRKQFTPDKMTVGMHFNYNEHCSYQTYLHLLELYDNDPEWQYLRTYRANDIARLINIKVIGFIERSFSSDERFIFARNGFKKARYGKPIEREIELTNKRTSGETRLSATSFPDTANDNTHSGLGFDYHIWARNPGLTNWASCFPIGHKRIRKHFSAKAQQLLELMDRAPRNQMQLPCWPL